ncbi:MAG: PAS domain S-box protein [Burkholderiaceae bacterium]|nr:PAS domain S-box protein [Burkholderiaceae bacterium]
MPAAPAFSRRFLLRRASNRIVLVSGGLLAAALVLTLVSLAWYERREALLSTFERSELLARVLSDHATGSVETSSLMLRTLAETISQQSQADPGRLQPLLSNSLQGLPFLRSLAVIDPQGRVLASSVHDDVGHVIDLKRLGPWPAVGAERLQSLLAGRGLADLLPGPAPARVTVTMLPLLRQVRTANGANLLLVALINPETLATYQQLTMAGSKSIAALMSYEGQVLAATETVSVEPSARLLTHPIYTDWLPKREHGSYVGAGVLPGEQVVAFRVSRSRPLLVSVELDLPTALQGWRDNMLWLLAFGAGALSLIAGACVIALRSLSVRESARQALDAAHEQVAWRERELQVLLKSLQELVFRTDAQGAITYVNARWEVLSQERAEQAIGRHLQELVEPAGRLQVQALFNPDDRIGIRTAAITVRAASGELLYFDVAVMPLFGPVAGRNTLIGFAGSAIDVTDRTNSRQRLQQQLALTGVLLEMSPLPVAMYDQHFNYLSLNQAWEQFTGLRRGDVIGKPLGRSLLPSDAAQHREQDKKLMAQAKVQGMALGGQLRYEAQLMGADGQRHDVLITKVLVPDENGGVRGTLCTLMDVTEFRNAERATREARDVAQETSRAKSEFVANMSHELRTPLQSILGFSELGLKKAREHASLVEMFGEIHASGERMLALVNDLLDVAKIESAVGIFELERTDLRGLVQQVLRELRPLLDQRHLKLSLQLPDQPLAAQVDAVRFSQVLRNVLANAIKFSPQGGQLRLSAERSANGEAHLSVADQGPGIPEAELEKIFEAFVQSSQTKDGAGGTGLGLAICRKILEVHGGRIYAENGVGGGAVLHIVLPPRSSPDSQMGSF